jgi:hypothetical protein
MKLYEVPRNTWIRVNVPNTMAPLDARTARPRERIKFINLDGMYSYCLDEQGGVVHLPVDMEVEIDNGIV